MINLYRVFFDDSPDHFKLIIACGPEHARYLFYSMFPEKDRSVSSVFLGSLDGYIIF